MKKSDIYTSGFLKAEVLAEGPGKWGTMTVTVKGIRDHTFEDGKKQAVLSFEEDDRELGLNITNWDTMEELTGEHDSDNWVGHTIELYVDPKVMFAGKRTPAIRIREATGKPAAGGPPPKKPAGGPPPKKAAEVHTKETAWDRWATSSGGSEKVDQEAWQAAIDKVGPDEDAFTSDDWKKVAAVAIPF